MPPIREVKTLLNLSINGLSLIVRQEALRVSNVVEEKFIYQQIPGTDDFDFEEEDQINSDREIFLSDQVQAIKVNNLVMHPSSAQLASSLGSAGGFSA